MEFIGKWIWFEAGQQTNVFARARRIFELEKAPAAGNLLITCSGNYRLWVNGEFAGRGPSRAPAHKTRYDALDISRFLKAGRNVLAVHLVHYGYAFSKAPQAPGGFWCHLELDGQPAFGSDDRWKFAIDPCFATNSERRNQDFGVCEVYDAQREDEWLSAAFNDAGWKTARHVEHGPHNPAGARTYPWFDIIPRGVPQCREESIRPTAVVKTAEVYEQVFVPGMVQGPSVSNIAVHLLQDVPFAPEFTSIENADALLREGGEPAIAKAPHPADYTQVERRSPTLILDFGREITGFGWIDVEGNAGAIVDAAYGERLLAGRVQAVLQNTAYADRCILKQGRQRHEAYDWKGFRYVQLTFRNLTEPLKVHGVGCTFSSYPVEPVGAFDCSDAKTSAIWRVGAYTQQLCMHDVLMDCPWREQAQWLGDGRVQLLIIQNAFGDRPMPRKFVEQFAEEQDSAGQMPARSLVAGWIVDYTLWWVVAVKDVLLFDRDGEFASRMMPTMQKLFAWYDAYLTDEGFIKNPAGWTFIDWAALGREGESATLNLIYHYALHCGAEVADFAGFSNLGREWRAKASRIAERFHEKFYDEAEGLYADNIADGQRTKIFSQHAQAMAALTGLARVDNKSLLERALEKKDIVETEPYFSFYLVEALARNGLAEAGYAFIRDRWGAMLDQGATTFWEEWQILGTKRQGAWWALPRSQCHAWSAAPTAWLSRYVLGVRVESLTEDKIIVEPNPCGLTQASGDVPTQFGVVRIRWEIANGELRVEVDAPSEAAIDFRPPAEFAGKAQLKRTC